jgi:hypothetical protein
VTEMSHLALEWLTKDTEFKYVFRHGKPVPVEVRLETVCNSYVGSCRDDCPAQTVAMEKNCCVQNVP